MEQDQKIEMQKLELQSPAKEVAGRAIGRHGLAYITLIIFVGVGASIILEGEKIAAVMGLLGAALTALISMLNGIAGTAAKQEKPEYEVIKALIERLDKKESVQVNVIDGKVSVAKGDDVITTS
jgi:hypothetical protein